MQRTPEAVVPMRASYRRRGCRPSATWLLAAVLSEACPCHREPVPLVAGKSLFLLNVLLSSEPSLRGKELGGCFQEFSLPIHSYLSITCSSPPSLPFITHAGTCTHTHSHIHSLEPSHVPKFSFHPQTGAEKGPLGQC